MTGGAWSETASDEIDLRLYVERLWRARYLILGVTLAAAGIAFGASRLFLPKVYEASTLLVVETETTPADRQAAPVRGVALSPAGYREIVESDAFQRLARESSGLPEGGGDGLAIRARAVPQANLLELTAEALDPKTAARAADHAATLLVAEVDRVNEERIRSALELLERQQAAAEQEMEQAVEALRAFAESHPVVEQLQREQWATLGLIATYQSRLAELEIAIGTQAAGVDELRRRLDAEAPTLVLDRALVPEATMLPEAARQSPGAQASRPVVSLQDERINPVYVELRTQLNAREPQLVELRAEREHLQESLAELTDRAQALTGQLLDLQAQQQILESRVEVARRSYETASSQYQMQRAALAGRIGESTLTVVRPAVEPMSPSRPRTLLNTVVAAFLAAMMSVFGVFIADWLRQEPPKEAPQHAGGGTIGEPERAAPAALESPVGRGAPPDGAMGRA